MHNDIRSAAASRNEMETAIAAVPDYATVVNRLGLAYDETSRPRQEINLIIELNASYNLRNIPVRHARGGVV